MKELIERAFEVHDALRYCVACVDYCQVMQQRNKNCLWLQVDVGNRFLVLRRKKGR